MKRFTIILPNVGSINVSDIDSAIKTVGLPIDSFVFVDWGNNTHLGIIEDLNSDCLPMEMLLMYLTKLVESRSNEL